MSTAVTCNTCEKNYEIKTKKVNIICCDDTDDWTFSFLCSHCGRIQTGIPSQKNLEKLIHAGANIVVWDMPEIPQMDGPPFSNNDVERFRKLLDSTPYITELVEAV